MICFLSILNISYKWNHMIHDLLCLRLSCGIVFSFLLVLQGNFPLHGYTTFCLSLFQLVDMRVLSTFWFFKVCCCEHSCKSLLMGMFSFLLGFYLGVGLLGHKVTLCVIIWGNYQPFPTLAILFAFRQQYMWTPLVI